MTYCGAQFIKHDLNFCRVLRDHLKRVSEPRSIFSNDSTIFSKIQYHSIGFMGKLCFFLLQIISNFCDATFTHVLVIPIANFPQDFATADRQKFRQTNMLWVAWGEKSCHALTGKYLILSNFTTYSLYVHYKE